MNFKTEQEKFWKGEFGGNYIERNKDVTLIKNNIYLFSKILSKLKIPMKSIIEFGANIGLNLIAIKTLFPNAHISALEINDKAVEKLKQLNLNKIYHESILNWKVDEQFDFVFTKGLLIHINPDRLDEVYEKMYQASNRYICITEYYNPTPVEVNYRGFKDKLFKRDFAGELLDKYKNLKLIDYGFIYHRDNQFPSDDVTWFLLEKK